MAKKMRTAEEWADELMRCNPADVHHLERTRNQVWRIQADVKRDAARQCEEHANRFVLRDELLKQAKELEEAK